MHPHKLNIPEIKLILLYLLDWVKQITSNALAISLQMTLLLRSDTMKTNQMMLHHLLPGYVIMLHQTEFCQLCASETERIISQQNPPCWFHFQSPDFNLSYS